MEITAGDVVVLKSGSRPMTVQWVNRDNSAGVVWEDKDGVHRTANYNTASLVKEAAG